MYLMYHLEYTKGGCTFHRLGLLACSDSKLTSETVNIFKHFGMTP